MIQHNQAHAVEKGDPRVDGPYLDDIRADQERAYRESRMHANDPDPVAEVEDAVSNVVELRFLDAQNVSSENEQPAGQDSEDE